MNTDSKSPEIGAGLLAGLKFILHSAAYQTLGSRRVMRRSDDDQIFMSTDALSKVNPKKLWLLVGSRLSSLKARSVKIPPVSRLEKDTRARYNLVPDSKSTSVRNFVTAMNNTLDTCPPPPYSTEAFNHTVEALLPVAKSKAVNQRSNISPGLDMIVADMIKHAPPSFIKGVCIFVAVMKFFGGSPRELLLGIFSFIPKSEDRWRGIRRASILAKLIETLVTHPLFPAIGPSGSLTCKEQFAGRRALGSDLAALSLSILISLCDHPLFVVFTDAVSAYDRVWKQALYAKLARQHHSLAEVKQLAMLYEWMESVIKNGNEISDVISSIIGIAQGGAKSAELFCAFMADLPEDIRDFIPVFDNGFHP